MVSGGCFRSSTNRAVCPTHCREPRRGLHATCARRHSWHSPRPGATVRLLAAHRDATPLIVFTPDPHVRAQTVGRVGCTCTRRPVPRAHVRDDRPDGRFAARARLCREGRSGRARRGQSAGNARQHEHGACAPCRPLLIRRCDASGHRRRRASRGRPSAGPAGERFGSNTAASSFRGDGSSL